MALNSTRYDLDKMAERLYRGEPAFGVRSTDKLAIPTVEAYIMKQVQSDNPDPLMIESLSQLRDRIAEWQKLNRHLVKQADVPADMVVLDVKRAKYVPTPAIDADSNEMNVLLEEIRAASINIPNHYVNSTFLEDSVEFYSPNIKFRMSKAQAVAFAKQTLNEYYDMV